MTLSERAAAQARVRRQLVNLSIGAVPQGRSPERLQEIAQLKNVLAEMSMQTAQPASRTVAQGTASAAKARQLARTLKAARALAKSGAEALKPATPHARPQKVFTGPQGWWQWLTGK